MAAPAEARIKYVLGKGPRTGSPSTITGHSQAVYSYDKCIAKRDMSGAWTIVTPEYSNTTKRHVRACYWAFKELGIPYTVVDYYTGQPVTGGKS